MFFSNVSGLKAQIYLNELLNIREEPSIDIHRHTQCWQLHTWQRLHCIQSRHQHAWRFQSTNRLHPCCNNKEKYIRNYARTLIKNNIYLLKIWNDLMPCYTLDRPSKWLMQSIKMLKMIWLMWQHITLNFQLLFIFYFYCNSFQQNTQI